MDHDDYTYKPWPRKDLIDTRGRKRRRDSAHTPSGTRTRSRSREPAPDRNRPSVDLGALLYPTYVPPHTYQALQSLLFELNDIITDREAEIRFCNEQVRLLHLLVDELKGQLRNEQETVRREQDLVKNGQAQISTLRKELAKTKKDQAGETGEFHDRKDYLRGVNDDQADLMQAGSRILAEKNGEAAQLAEENSELRDTIIDRDYTISLLNDQIIRIANAPGNELAAAAVEVQAQRTLAMVQGLNADVAQRDSMIEDCERKYEMLRDANEKLRSENEGWKSKCLSSERAYQAVDKHAAEAKAILEDQNSLIKELMRDNVALWVAGQAK